MHLTCPLALLLIAAAAVAGCSGSGGSSAPSTPPRPVTAESFVVPIDTTAATPAATSTPATAHAEAATRPATAAAKARQPRAVPEPAPAVGEPTLDTAAVVGQPTPSPSAKPAPGASGGPVILESLIGQVNGRPVFASEILEPLDAQLRAEAAKAKDRREFETVAAKLIGRSVWQVVKDELILAEARASLTPEQKQGLFQFLSKLQEDVVSQQKGSAVAADEALRASRGLSLQEAAQDRLDQELIINEIRQRVAPRVIVTPRQIQQEYERNYDKYNPKPVATYRLISVDARKPEVIEQVSAELASGKSFTEVADSDINTLSKSKDGGRVAVQLTGASDQALFSVPALSDAARPLKVGEHAGPVVSGNYARWVSLETQEQAAPVSLYDAQLEIETALRESRFQTETERYFDRLRKRGSVSRIEDMVIRLLYIAEQRYLSPSVQ